MERKWTVEFHPECEEWANTLPSEDRRRLLVAVEMLEEQGPTLGRPLVDSIKGSRLRNMKELRPPSHGRSEIRVLFAFDPVRHAILLVGGDKSGRWSRWYHVAIPEAERRFEEHMRGLSS